MTVPRHRRRDHAKRDRRAPRVGVRQRAGDGVHHGRGPALAEEVDRAREGGAGMQSGEHGALKVEDGIVPGRIDAGCAEEAINAATINAAYAMGILDSHGSITKGKAANLILTDNIPSYGFLPYSFGANHINSVYINGKKV